MSKITMWLFLPSSLEMVVFPLKLYWVDTKEKYIGNKVNTFVFSDLRYLVFMGIFWHHGKNTI